MRTRRWLHIIPLRFRSLLRPKAVEAELDEELQFHIQSRINLLMMEGRSLEEARRVAERNIGRLTQIKEECRDMRKLNLLENLVQDVRYAIRAFAKSPVFTATAILSLALGIGANTAIFSLVDAVLLKNLPVNRPQELVTLTHLSREGNAGEDFSYPEYLEFRSARHALAGLLAASGTRPASLGLLDTTDTAQTKFASDTYFSVLGIRPVLGRVFQAQDDARPVAVISARFWTESLAGSPGVLGRQLTLEGVPFTVIGVAQPEFESESVGETPDLWASVSLVEAARRDSAGFTWLNIMGRLASGNSATQATAELNVIAARSNLETRHRIVVDSGARGFSRLRDRVSRPLRVLMAIMAVVLLIACANLASLLLARSVARQREFATRLAIGAGRGRVIGQLLTESLLISATGGVLGVLFAWWSGRLLVNLVVAGFPRGVTLDLSLDFRVLLFTAALSLFTGLLFGLAPAFEMACGDVGQRLKRNAHTFAGGERRWRLKDVLIVSQIGLSLLLLVVAGLFIGTLRNLKTQDTGLRAENVLLVELGGQRGRRPDPVRILGVLASMRALPGVQAASMSLNSPLADDGSGVYGLKVEGYVPNTPEDQRARADWVGPAYLETVGIPLLEGRDLSPADNATAPKVAIVNQTMARHYFGAASAVGRRFEFNQQFYQIVGIAKDTKYTDLRAPSPRVVYFAALQRVGGIGSLEVRTVNGPLAVAESLRASIREMDPGLRIGEITTVPQRIKRKLSREYLVADLAGFFGGLGLLLVSIGIYGTLAYAVIQRTNEIGIRMALGAAPRSVLNMVLRETLLRLVVGLLLGLGAALAITRFLAAMLFGLTPMDLATIALAAVVVIAMSMGASYFPARRASRIDAVAALRLD